MLNSSSSAVEIGLAPAPARLDHLEHGADVVLDVEAAEDRGFLRQIADAEAGALIHRQRRDVVAVELDAAAIGRDQAGDHVEHGGLAGAVGPEQADRLAAPHIEADALHHLAADEALLDAVRREIAMGGVMPGVAVGVAARPRSGVLATCRFGTGLSCGFGSCCRDPVFSLPVFWLPASSDPVGFDPDGSAPAGSTAGRAGGSCARPSSRTSGRRPATRWCAAASADVVAPRSALAPKQCE